MQVLTSDQPGCSVPAIFVYTWLLHEEILDLNFRVFEKYPWMNCFKYWINDRLKFGPALHPTLLKFKLVFVGMYCALLTEFLCCWVQESEKYAVSGLNTY